MTSDPSTRYVELADGEDLLLRATHPVRFAAEAPFGRYADAMVTIVGGRNVVMIGAHFIGERSPMASVAAEVGREDTVIKVTTTAGFPPSGQLRCDGELMTYTSRTSNSFIVSARRAGYFLDSKISSDSLHRVGSPIYLGEYSRSALSLRSQTGAVHIEGFQADGFLNDGIRIRGSASTTVTLQNFRIGPVTNHDPVGWTDGHPDCIQTWGNGVGHLRLSHGTLIAGRAGKGIENAADTTSGKPVGRITMLNTEIVDAGTTFLLSNRSPATQWEVCNSWLVTDLPKKTAVRGSDTADDDAFREMIGIESAANDQAFVMGQTSDAPYISPGYLQP
ncbi:hypothetical protein [Pseudarthrobacter sp. MEB009]|uniref:hypothetical protein n=1 Tax=Pseudarthrobacter sp. MEB009 TaxID=3040326 RepID=UPI0025547FA8|nr:hypothetical protein [Pseudarthrobacter sp. MEB009]